MLLHKLFIRHVKASIQEFSWINRKGYELFQQLKKASFKKKLATKLLKRAITSGDGLRLSSIKPLNMRNKYDTD